METHRSDLGVTKKNDSHYSVEIAFFNQSENPVEVIRRDFRFIIFVLRFSVFIFHWR